MQPTASENLSKIYLEKAEFVDEVNPVLARTNIHKHSRLTKVMIQLKNFYYKFYVLKY